MKSSKTVLLTVVAALAAGSAPNSALAADKAPPNPKFVQLDRDRDGFLTMPELIGRPGYQRAFAEADDNRDGKLDETEFIKAEANYDRMRAATYAKDRVITAKVKTALIKSPSVHARDVEVDTYDGRVLLTGYIKSPEQKQRAIEIAAGVSGVKVVEDGMVLR